MAKPAPFELIAGNTALDFANTLDDRYSPAGERELLQSYGDLLRFGAQTRILAPPELHRLHRLASRTGPDESAAALRSALRLREAIERIFGAFARDNAQVNAQANGQRHPRPGRPAANDLAILNGYVKNALAHRRIAPAAASARASTFGHDDVAFAWQWVGRGSDLTPPCWPLALAAAELLVSNQRALVRECRSATCRWLFLDQSKNHSRRWCDMKTCGNRVKARRYYRTHGARP